MQGNSALVADVSLGKQSQQNSQRSHGCMFQLLVVNLPPSWWQRQYVSGVTDWMDQTKLRAKTAQFEVLHQEAIQLQCGTLADALLPCHAERSGCHQVQPEEKTAQKDTCPTCPVWCQSLLSLVTLFTKSPLVLLRVRLLLLTSLFLFPFHPSLPLFLFILSCLLPFHSLCIFFHAFLSFLFFFPLTCCLS